MTRGNGSRDAREQLVAKWTASGKTAAEFGARHGLTSSTLYWWARDLKKALRGQAFVEVQVREPEGSVEIVLASGRVVRVREVVDARVLRSVLEALESC